MRVIFVFSISQLTEIVEVVVKEIKILLKKYHITHDTLTYKFKKLIY